MCDIDKNNRGWIMQWCPYCQKSQETIVEYRKESGWRQIIRESCSICKKFLCETRYPEVKKGVS